MVRLWQLVPTAVPALVVLPVWAVVPIAAAAGALLL